jgi:diaminopimelate epimerase
MALRFTKMHGLGNDFAVLDARAGTPPLDASRVRAMSDRHTGIGFDQLLVIEPPRDPSCIAAYSIRNADGSPAEQCGNGARCIGAWLYRDGVLAIGDEVKLESPSGEVAMRLADATTVTVAMGEPVFEPARIPFDAPALADIYPLEIGGERVEIAAVSMGNPHAVLTVSSVASAPVDRLGPAIEKHPRFPNRVNVGFMEIVDRAHVRLRVFERGVGETLACGTGACAAVAVGRRHGRLDATVEVQLPGGNLELTWPGPGEHIWMKGPTAVSFTGRVEI